MSAALDMVVAEARAAGLVGGKETRSQHGRAPGAAEARAKGSTVVGYGAVFGEVATIGGLFDERVAPGAFAGTLRDGGAVLSFNHDVNFVLARHPGTLDLREDATGLRYEASVDPGNPQAAAVLSALRRGDVRGSSFMFSATGEEWQDGPERPLRTLTRVRLYELGPVVFPAYSGTSSSARYAAAAMARRHARRQGMYKVSR